MIRKTSAEKRETLRSIQNSHTRRVASDSNFEKRMASIQSMNEKYGRIQELINLGKEDRLKGKQPNTTNCTGERKKTSYNYGYFEQGSRALAGFFVNNKTSQEEQFERGKIDFENGVPKEYLANFKDFPSYIEGYNYQNAFNLGIDSYNYITEQDISLENYIEIMKLFCPLVTTEAFKQGYESKKAKCEQSSSKVRK